MNLTEGISTKNFFENAYRESSISDERKSVLISIAHFIVKERLNFKKVRVNFICTHNSRRSQIAQVWAHYAIQHYNLKRIKCYSGGTDPKRMHKYAIRTLQLSGFKFKLLNFSHENPIYEISYLDCKKPIKCFSKAFSDPINKKPFIAITCCPSAEEQCPNIPDALVRFHLNYEDPKSYDHTPIMEQKYLEISQEIAAEMSFLFSKVASLL